MTPGANLYGANLEAQACTAILTNANLYDSELRNANLRANLRGANLRRKLETDLIEQSKIRLTL